MAKNKYIYFGLKQHALKGTTLVAVVLLMKGQTAVSHGEVSQIWADPLPRAVVGGRKM